MSIGAHRTFGFRDRASQLVFRPGLDWRSANMAIAENDDRLLLRLPEVAKRLGLGRSTVYELIQRGELPVVRVGRAVRVPSAALQRWVERQTDGATDG